MRRRLPIPPPYDNPPTIGVEFDAFFWAFLELSREREPPTANGKQVTVKRISYRALREWAEYRGFSSDEDFMYELTEYVRALDTVWVEHETKRLTRDIGKSDG